MKARKVFISRLKQVETGRGLLMASRVARASILALAIAIALPAAAQAAAPRSFMVAPVKLEFAGLAGQSSGNTILVVNLGTTPLRITSGFLDYLLTPNNSFVFSPPGHESYSCSRWMTLDPPTFELPPGKTQKVKVALSIPNSAELGGHYGLVYFETKGAKPTGSGLGVTGRIGTVILTTVGDPSLIVRDGLITHFGVSNPLWASDTNSTVVFRDTGNVHLTLKGVIDIQDIFGRKVTQLPLQSITILPHTDRILPVHWRGPLIGLFRAKPHVSFGPNLYTYTTERTAGEVFFWIIPWQLILLATLILVVLAWRLYAWRKKRLEAYAQHAQAPGQADEDSLGGSAGHVPQPAMVSHRK